MRMKICIDIDSTLTDFLTHARDVASKMADESPYHIDPERAILLNYGSETPWPEWKSPNEIFGHDLWMEILNRTHSPVEILAQEPFENAVEIINRWIQVGHEVVFISSRDHDETAEATEQWLQKIRILDPRLICTGRAGSKIPTLIQEGIDVLIDDRPQTLIEFAYETPDPVAAIGIKHEANVCLSDVPALDMVDSWSEIPRVLEARSQRYLLGI